MSHTVILFAKAPRYACVKSRLARDIGPLRALQFYKNNLKSVAWRLHRSPKYNLIMGITPDSALLSNDPILEPFTLQPQRSGDLGDRMARAFRSIPSGPAVIVGSDIPDISTHHITSAFKALGRSDVVFGPCSDGGYWLVGVKKPQALPYGFMKNVTWSTNVALEETIGTLPKHCKISYIAELDDIDTGDDYANWKFRSETSTMKRDA